MFILHAIKPIKIIFSVIMLITLPCIIISGYYIEKHNTRAENNLVEQISKKRSERNKYILDPKKYHKLSKQIDDLENQYINLKRKDKENGK